MNNPIMEASSVSTLDPTMVRALERGMDPARVPAHVAIIMDGNGRWATRQGQERLAGHHEGYRTLRDVLMHAKELGVQYLTVYAFSTENWRRPESEVSGLMTLLATAARDELRTMVQNNVRFRIAGRVHELNDELRQALVSAVEFTQGNTGIVLTLAVNYGGRAEIVDAVRRLVADGVPPEQIDEEAIAARLYNPEIPEPDLVIRTAGEMRSSNFLTWQSAYSELVVLPCSWPEFDEEQLIDAVLEYQRRTRKFGGISSN